MSIFDFLRGEFIDVIHWTDDTRDTLVWTPGQDGWKEADEVPALAQLFTMLPPPLPQR